MNASASWNTCVPLWQWKFGHYSGNHGVPEILEVIFLKKLNVELCPSSLAQDSLRNMAEDALWKT